MNRHTIICAVFCENAQPKLKNNDIQHDTSKTNFLPILSYSDNGAIINGPNAHAKIWIDTTMAWTTSDVMPNATLISLIAGDNILDDIGATKAYRETKPKRKIFNEADQFLGSSGSSVPFQVINSGSILMKSSPCWVTGSTWSSITPSSNSFSFNSSLLTSSAILCSISPKILLLVAIRWSSISSLFKSP